MVTSCDNARRAAMIPNEQSTIVERLQRGDVRAVGEFVQRHRVSLLHQIDRNLSASVRSKVEPEDLLQEVTLAAIRTIGRNGLRTAHPLQWFRRLIRQRIVSAYRRHFQSRKRDAHREVSFHAAEDSSWLADRSPEGRNTPSDVLNRQEQYERVRGVCRQLSQGQQQLLTLRFQQGLSSKEIGDKMSKSDGAVRVMLSRTLSKVRRLMEDE